MTHRGIGVGIGSVAAAAAIALAAGQADAGANLRDCGDAVKSGAGAFEIRASAGVGCKQAKRVARHFYPGGEDHYRSWRCEGRLIGEELGKATCRRGKKPDRDTIKFSYGA